MARPRGMGDAIRALGAAAFSHIAHEAVSKAKQKLNLGGSNKLGGGFPSLGSIPVPKGIPFLPRSGKSATTTNTGGGGQASSVRILTKRKRKRKPKRANTQAQKLKRLSKRVHNLDKYTTINNYHFRYVNSFALTHAINERKFDGAFNQTRAGINSLIANNVPVYSGTAFVSGDLHALNSTGDVNFHIKAKLIIRNNTNSPQRIQVTEWKCLEYTNDSPYNIVQEFWGHQVAIPPGSAATVPPEYWNVSDASVARLYSIWKSLQRVDWRYINPGEQIEFFQNYNEKWSGSDYNDNAYVYGPNFGSRYVAVIHEGPVVHDSTVHTNVGLGPGQLDMYQEREYLVKAGMQGPKLTWYAGVGYTGRTPAPTIAEQGGLDNEVEVYEN